jgi:hypothetical protein
MRTYFYRRANGETVRIECEQMFWSGTACVFVRGGLAAAVIALLPGELVVEENVIKEVAPELSDDKRPN